MIVMAKMFPARAEKSGRRYFKGQSRYGTFWLLESEPGLWTLKFDPRADASTPFTNTPSIGPGRAERAPALAGSIKESRS